MSALRVSLLFLAVVSSILAYSAELAALKGINIVSALDSVPRQVDTLLVETNNRDNLSMMICFRSFG